MKPMHLLGYAELKVEIERLTVENVQLFKAFRGATRENAKLRAALESARKEAKFIADDIDAVLASEQDE